MSWIRSSSIHQPPFSKPTTLRVPLPSSGTEVPSQGGQEDGVKSSQTNGTHAVAASNTILTNIPLRDCLSRALSGVSSTQVGSSGVTLCLGRG